MQLRLRALFINWFLTILDNANANGDGKTVPTTPQQNKLSLSKQWSGASMSQTWSCMAAVFDYDKFATAFRQTAAF